MTIGGGGGYNDWYLDWRSYTPETSESPIGDLGRRKREKIPDPDVEIWNMPVSVICPAGGKTAVEVYRRGGREYVGPFRRGRCLSWRSGCPVERWYSWTEQLVEIVMQKNDGEMRVKPKIGRCPRME